MSKIVVVGANHAGTAAVNTLLNLKKDNEVVVFDRNSNISFLGCGMALWIGKQIAGPDGLFYSSKEELEKKGAKINMETEVEKIDFKNKRIFVKEKDGKTYDTHYDKLILATGSLPIVPNVKGTDLDNVQLVKLYQNAQEVIEKLNNDDIRHVTVVGAGYIGVELAEAFKRNGKEVALIDVAPTSLSSYYDLEFTHLMDDNLRNHGIDLHFEEKLVEIQGNGKVEKVITDKSQIPTDMVVLCIGFKPNNSLGKDDLKLFRNGAFLVNKKQETSIKDVYAIGDCATVYDNAIDAPNYIALATNAVRSGIIAAHNASGVELESVGVQGSNGINIFDFKMVSTGLSLAKANAVGFNALATDYEDLQKPEFITENNEKVKIRIVYDKDTRRVLGAQMASKYDVSMGIHFFSLAIQEKVTIDK